MGDDQVVGGNAGGDGTDAAEAESDSTRLFVGIGVALVLFGVGLTAMSLLSAADATAAADEGVETEGTVLETALEEYQERATDDDGNRVTVTRYRAQVEYQYTADGQTYTSTTIVVPPLVTEPHGRDYDERSDAKSFLADYPEGEPTTVYYMPDDHGKSFLVKPDYDPFTMLFPFIFGLAFAGPGGAILLWSFGVIGNRDEETDEESTDAAAESGPGA